MNSPVAQLETPEHAAERLARRYIHGGARVAAVHAYRLADGAVWCWKIRARLPDGSKTLRPMRASGQGYVLGEAPPPPSGKPLYRLPELMAADPAEPVWIAEGEACCDGLHALGVIATTSGSCASADGADWAPLKGRSVTAWPDCDSPGAKYAMDVARRLQGLGCHVRLIAPEIVEGLPEHGDVVDWLQAHPGATRADVEALPTVEASPGAARNVAEVAGVAMGETVEPEPLRRPLPGAAPYPMGALGEVLGSAACAIADVVQAPDAMCGVSVLTGASLAAQGQADVMHDGRTEPLSLWAVTVGESGERKTGIDDWALGAHRKHEHDAQAAYRTDLGTYAVAQAAYAAARSKATGGKGATRESISRALEDVGEAPSAPLVPILTLGEPTLEGAQRQLINGWPSLGIFSSDAGEFLGGFSMGREQRMRTAASLSKLWDRGAFDRVRAKTDEPSGKHYGKRLALHLMVQPVIAETVLSDELLTGQGFLSRCLLAWPTSTIGTREYVSRDLHQDPALVRYWAKVHALLDRPYPLAEGTRNELAPRVLTLVPEAATLWTQVQDATERQMAEHGSYATVRAWASKTGSQVLRIAGVLTVVENPDAPSIGRATIERAAELALWHLGEAVRIVGTASVPPEIRNAEALRDWCTQTGRGLLHSRDALQFGPGCIRTADTFDEAIRVLERTGWAHPVEGGAVVGGKRRRRVWQMVRAAP